MKIKDFLALICSEDERIKIYDYKSDSYVDEFWLSDYRRNPGSHPVVENEISCFDSMMFAIEIFING